MTFTIKQISDEPIIILRFIKTKIMDKKVGNIIDAFQNYKFQDTLRQIDQLKKKIQKDSKKKTTLSDKDDRILHIIQCGSLAQTGRIHEAHHIFNNYFTSKVIAEIPADQTFLFFSIAQLVYDNKILEHIQQIKKNTKSEGHFERFMLSRRLFSEVSKAFLREYVSGKRQQDGLAQIFLQYLNQINKKHSIQEDFERDLKIAPQKQLNLKMVELFFNKYLTGLNLAELKNVKLRASIIDLKQRIAINSNRDQQAKNIYLENFQYIQENFVYLRSIRDMPQNQQKNHRFYIQNCGVIFKRNLQIQKYVPLYDYYNQFLDFIFSSQMTTDFLNIANQLEIDNQLKKEEVYNFQSVDNGKILCHYYGSLKTQLFALTDGVTHQKAKTSDYYKISIKGLLLQLLKIIFEVSRRTNNLEKLSSHKIFNELLEMYFIYFSKTLTYINEMKSYLVYLKKKFINLSDQQLPSIFSKKDDNLILLINKVKILAILDQNQFLNLEQTEKFCEICWSYYKKYILQVEQSKNRQKGQVYLSDQFITLLADAIIFFLQNTHKEEENSQSIRESLLAKLTAILDYTTQLSPYNAYLKLRLIYVCQKMNYFDKLLDTFLSMDIKSVQFQTLGYFLINPVLNFNLFTQYETNLIKMARSYYQNQRQTSEYCLKGLKAGVTHQTFEYFSYQKRVEKSFSKMMLFYALYLKHQNQNDSQFYLQWIKNQLKQYHEINKKVSFNCDRKTMSNLISSLGGSQNYQNTYNEYYGYLNNVQVLQFAINLRLFESHVRNIFRLKSNNDDKDLQISLAQLTTQYTNLLKNNQNDNYVIEEQFNVIDEYLRKITIESAKTKYNYTKKVIQKDLQIFIKISEFKIQGFKLVLLLLNLLKQTEKNQQKEKYAQEQNKQQAQEQNKKQAQEQNKQQAQEQNKQQAQEQNKQQAQEQNKVLLFILEELMNYFQLKLNWRQQTKSCWEFRSALFSLCNIITILNEETIKNKKLPKSIKSLISSIHENLQKTTLFNASNLKFKQQACLSNNILKIQIDSKYIDKVFECDQILKRFVKMDQKQVKKYLLK